MCITMCVARLVIFGVRNRWTSLLPSAGAMAQKSCKWGRGCVYVKVPNFFTFSRTNVCGTLGAFFLILYKNITITLKNKNHRFPLRPSAFLPALLLHHFPTLFPTVFHISTKFSTLCKLHKNSSPFLCIHTKLKNFRKTYWHPLQGVLYCSRRLSKATFPPLSLLPSSLWDGVNFDKATRS